jgi:hypothetical protein
VQLIEGSVRAAGKYGEPIEEHQLVMHRRPFGTGHCTPDIPGQHLDPVQRRDIAHQVLGDKPKAAQCQNPELVGVRATGAV